jgi:hypothetical protein
LEKPLGSPSGSPERGRIGLVLLLLLVAVVVVGLAGWLFLRERPMVPGPATSPRPEPTPRPATAPSASPAARTGAVEISASVAGSTVLVDGRSVGPAPQRIELEAGSHQVRVEKQGFQAFVREVHVVRGRTLELEARLEVVPPHLRVEADVPGAQVFLDRQFVGEAPVTVRDVALGGHRLDVSAEGYPMHAQTIEVVSGANQVVVRLKEVHLDETLAVKHKHGIGSCRGRLLATPEGIRYESDHEDDQFSAPFPTLEPLEVDYLDKNLRVKVKGGRTYNFTAESADDLLVFQKAVEAARARLKQADAGASP